MLRYIIAGSIGQGTEAIGRFFALSLLIWCISLISQAQVIIPPNRYTPRDMQIRDISPPIQVPRFELPGLLRPNPGGGDDDDDPYELLNSLTMEGFVRAEEESGDSVTLEGISPSEESNVYGWIHHPPKITLGVRIASKGESPLVFGERDKVNIEANIYLNGRRIHRLKMLDNGKSGDSEGDDGVYSCVFIPRSVGTYEFQAKAKLVVYRHGRIFRKNLNTKRITFYVVAVPYAQVEQPSDGAVLQEDFRVIARIFQLKKPYKEMESPIEATLIVSSEEHHEEIPMQRSDSTLTASFNVPKNGIYNISINLRHSIKGRLFSVSTNPVAVRVEKPVSLLVLALYALPVLAVLIIFFLTYAKNAK